MSAVNLNATHTKVIGSRKGPAEITGQTMDRDGEARGVHDWHQCRIRQGGNKLAASVSHSELVRQSSGS